MYDLLDCAPISPQFRRTSSQSIWLTRTGANGGRYTVCEGICNRHWTSMTALRLSPESRQNFTKIRRTGHCHFDIQNHARPKGEPPAESSDGVSSWKRLREKRATNKHDWRKHPENFPNWIIRHASGTEASQVGPVSPLGLLQNAWKGHNCRSTLYFGGFSGYRATVWLLRPRRVRYSGDIVGGNPRAIDGIRR